MSVLPSVEEIQKSIIEKRRVTLERLWMKKYLGDWFVAWGGHYNETGIVSFTTSQRSAVVYISSTDYGIRIWADKAGAFLDERTAKHPDLALDAVARWVLQGVI